MVDRKSRTTRKLVSPTLDEPSIRKPMLTEFRQYTYEQTLEFGLSDYLSREEVVGALGKIRYMNGGTATGQAINYDLRAMASAPPERHTFFSREFSGLASFPQDLVKTICQDFSTNN
ncbi:hypothetical protein CRUP_014822 [Coryphaenoides rupestris]|nr:hypothetical protein CRUP_014822 [Coryphaenoides rupestris]